jgi:hypothetical protein
MSSTPVRAPFSYFDIRTRKPSDARIRRVLSQAREAWDDLVEYLEQIHGLKGSLHFMYGRRYGWALRVRRGSRLVLALYPNQSSLTVQIILGRAQVEAAAAMGLPSRVLEILESATNYPEGKWLFIPVKSLANARELRPLIALKISGLKSSQASKRH